MKENIKQIKLKGLLSALWFFSQIVWREWDRIEVEKGKWVTLRIGWSAAWKVAKNIYMT